jgi:tetratricopeptide (TPR) repeat protein
MTRALILNILVLGPLCAAGAQPSKVDWSADDVRGQRVKVPSTRPTVLAFILADQPPSAQALTQIQSVVRDARSAALVIVVSGKDAQTFAQALAQHPKTQWPVVADPDYAASGKLLVHAWPTTLVVSSDGRQIAHVPGVPKSLAKDLDSYLAFAGGAIDEAQLQQRLNGHDMVVDSTTQMASRHLQVAQRLLDKGLPEQARIELERGLKLESDNVPLQLALIDLLLSTGNASAADWLAKVDEKKVPPRRLQVLRGRLLIAQGQWDQARALLLQAAMLNPDPAEAYYHLGRVYQHMGNLKEAAEAYRRAFEATPLGHRAGTSDPTTQP